MFSHSVFHLFKYKNRRGKSKTIVGEIPTIDFMLFLIFCPVKWAFEMRKGVKAIFTVHCVIQVYGSLPYIKGPST
jgi:hypothetical protein